MQKEIVCNVNEDILRCGAEFSDRFVYSNYYIPLHITFNDGNTLILAEYKKTQLANTLKYSMADPLAILERLPTVGLGDLFKKNKVNLPSLKPENRPSRDSEPGFGAGLEVSSLAGDKIHAQVNDIKDLIEIFRGKLPDSDKGIITVMERKIEDIGASAREAVRLVGFVESKLEVSSPHQYGRQYFREDPAKLKEQEIEFFLNLLQSDIGYLFLDRTRIRPKGFAIGEHLYALSLAPGEEIVLEQKTFSKRQLTLEEQDEQEKQFDIELSSTLSTEIQEGFERQKNRTDSWGLSLSHTGQYSSPQFVWGQINASHTIGYTRNVTEADQETSRRSVKDSQTSSSKVASKYRALHKTTFKISTEEGFESTSKRVIRNPNRFTPIQLHYFKILQKLELTQERYGIRLCWAPSVKNPAFAFFDQIRKGKEEILTKARMSLPQKPVEPPPPPSGGQTSSQVEKRMFYSAIASANKWGLVGDMNADYEIDIIPNETGYTWDGNVEIIKANLNLITKRPNSGGGSARAEIKGVPIEMSDQGGKNTLRVTVHVDAALDFLVTPISFQVGAQFNKTLAVTAATNEDAKYKDSLVLFHTKLKEWEDNVAKVMAQAQKDADTWEEGIMKTMNPLTEMINCIIQQLFPPAVRDECWEIELWQKLFDWDRASYVVYPGWWSDLPMRDPTKDPSHFFNASWAKLYLPVRVGMERLALRWIFGKAVAVGLAPEIETQFEKIEEDLNRYRGNKFGSPSEIIELDRECRDFEEKVYCVSKWRELMPTDGTHLEVIQSCTSAADQFSRNEVDDADKLRNAMIENQKQDAELKKKAINQMTSPANIDINIGAEGGSNGG